MGEIDLGTNQPPVNFMRNAGRLEQYNNHRRILHLNSWVILVAKYESALGVPLRKAVVLTALQEVIRSHAALSSRLLSPPSPPYWVRLPSINLSEVVEFVDKDQGELHTILEEIYSKPMELAESAPLWRLLVLRDGTTLFMYDHTMGDGQSGVAFHIHFLNALNTVRPSTDAPADIVSDLPKDSMLTPAVEDAMDTNPPFTFAVRQIANLVFSPLRRARDAAAWTGLPVPPAPTQATSVRIFHLDAPTVAALAQLSRTHNTTLTGTLHTLALLVLSRRLRALPAGAGARPPVQTVPTTIPVSLRRYTGAPPTAFCNHFSAHVAHHLLLPVPASPSPGAGDDGFPWPVAAALSAELRLSAPRCVRTVGMLKFVAGKYREYLLGGLGKKRADGLELSNLGAFPAGAKGDGRGHAGPDGGWRIGKMVFVQANATLGSALKMNVVGDPEGGMGVSVTWSEGAVEEAVAADFAGALEEEIRSLLCGPDSSG